MAKFESNIFSIALGSVGSTTFSRARDRRGRIQTARSRVIPANPQTQPQTDARNNLTDSVRMAQQYLITESKPIWDRAVSKLPAYQSLMSVFQRAKIGSSGAVTFVNLVTGIYLGRLVQTDFNYSFPNPNEAHINWDPPLIGNQSPNDVLHGFVASRTFNAAFPPQNRMFVFGTQLPLKIRSDGNAFYDITNLANRGAGIAIMAYFVSPNINPSEAGGLMDMTIFL